MICLVAKEGREARKYDNLILSQLVYFELPDLLLHKYNQGSILSNKVWFN